MRTHATKLLASLACTALLPACNFGVSAPGAVPAAGRAASTPLPLPARAVDTAALLQQRPVVWFAPLPPMPTYPGREFIGSEDFMSLFEADAPWQTAASHVHVFKLYGEWVANHATDAQLRHAITDIQRRGMALAVEAGPLDPPADCGQGIEGFAGEQEGLKIASRIAAAGGTLHLIALDEPYFFAHVYDGPNACHWPVDKIAAEVDSYVHAMKDAIPGVVIGDTEPLSGAADDAAYRGWLDTFRQVNGYNLAFLHMDVDWSRPTWPQEVKSIAAYGSKAGVPVGMIYSGNGFDPTDEAWLSAAGERVKKYELEAGAAPEHVLFQSWNDKPDLVLPETQPFTWTNFINAYFTDKAALGYRREGAGGNLALGKPVRVSGETSGYGGAGAVDGDLGTLWNSGGGPVQWIEIDLGAPQSIRTIRLTVSQYPQGDTAHRVLARGPSGDFQLIYTFAGDTKDGNVLEYTAAHPIAGIQFIRIESTASPSWIAWREIEVIAAK